MKRTAQHNPRGRKATQRKIIRELRLLQAAVAQGIVVQSGLPSDEVFAPESRQEAWGPREPNNCPPPRFASSSSRDAARESTPLVVIKDDPPWLEPRVVFSTVAILEGREPGHFKVAPFNQYLCFAKRSDVIISSEKVEDLEGLRGAIAINFYKTLAISNKWRRQGESLEGTEGNYIPLDHLHVLATLHARV